jgi:hypothetical protein
MEIFPAITNLTPSGWKDKIKEVKELKLKEVCLFPTLLELDERKELYSLLEKTSVQRVPFVHIRSDMELWELDFLVKKYQTEVFNTHSTREYSFMNNLDKYRQSIYIENTKGYLDEEEIKGFGGICLDFSHLESNKRFHPDIYEKDLRLIEKYPIGCNHISPIKEYALLEKGKSYGYKPHFFEKLSEFDYLKNYPKKYFSNFLALELENSIQDQLKAKEYILGLI